MKKIAIFISSIILIGAQQKEVAGSKPEVSYQKINNNYTTVKSFASGKSSFKRLSDSLLVSTFVGSGNSGSVDSTGEAASFYGPSGQAIDSNGNLFITDTFNHLIRKITPAGVVTTFAGSGIAGSDDGTGTEASFNKPIDLDFDNDGNLFVVDFGSHLIRRIRPSGVVTTFAGTGESGSNDDSWGGAAARFNHPFSIAIFKEEGWSWTNNLFIADYGNHLIRMITNGDEDDAYNGETTTFAGSGIAGSVDNENFVEASFNGPVGLTWNADHKNLYVTEWSGHNIRRIDTNYETYGVYTFAGSGSRGSDDGTGTEASFNNPVGITIDNNENLFIADASNNKIRKITPLGVTTTYAGSGIQGIINGLPSEATFHKPYGVEISKNNRTIYVTDYWGNTIRKISPPNSPPVIASIDDITINEDESATVSINVTDSNDDPISFFVHADIRNQLRFDGDDDYVAIPDNASLNYGTDDFTYSAWFNTESVQGTQQIVHKRSGNNYEVQLSGSSIVAYIGEPGNEHSLLFSQISVDKWYHVLIGRTNGLATMYVNGVVVDTITATGSVTTTDPLYIGSDTGSEDFIGLIKDVAIWSHGLSDSAVTAIYNNGSPIDLTKNNKGYIYSDKLYGYWRLNDTSTIAKDLSGSVNDGTIYGAESITSDLKFITSTFSGSSLTLLPDPNWNGQSTITVIADDKYSYDTTSFTLTVTPVQDPPSAFEWISSASDTIAIDSTNLDSTYSLEWSASTDVDGEPINYFVYAKVGIYPEVEIYDGTSTSASLAYQEILEGVFEGLIVNGATIRLNVKATDGIDTLDVTGENRVLYVNRYDYLSVENEGLPTEFALHENYPNPFNPSTTLRFDLPYSSDVNLTIYNMLGQKVKSFDMRGIQAGKHTLRWNATNDLGEKVGTGVYLYQLQTKDFMKTRKMIFMK